MSSLKRKDAPAVNSSKKDAKPTTETRPSKKVKSEKPGKRDEKKSSKDMQKAPSSAPAITTIKEDEPLFPRGGGSVLTPLEHKQITIQAKQDALFEEESGKPPKTSEKVEKKRKRKSSTKEDKAGDKSARDEDAVRIEALNYKVRALQDDYHEKSNKSDLSYSVLSKDRWFSAKYAK